MSLSRAALLLGLVSLGASSQVQARTEPSFSSAHSLLLTKSVFPPHYRYRGSETVYTVQAWDGGVQPVIDLDSKNGWTEGAEETASDPRGHDVMLSAQIFSSAAGARGDFAQFFTNEHPQTRFVPGQTWLGGKTIRGFGDVATLYRISDENGRCPHQLLTGISFTYGNALLSVGVCTQTVGERGARDLASRLLRRAKALTAR